MNDIKTLVEGIESDIQDINDIIAQAEEKKFTYTVSKNIRKAAQSIKKTAQSLRTITSETYKKISAK